jgi:homopolymeric O-antigen transport system permease protein
MATRFHTTRPHQLRDFIWTLVRTDFKARYHGEVSGFVWALLKPLVMFVALYAVFSFLFRDQKYLFNLMVGLLVWNFFSESTSVGLESLLRKGFLITKARFPRPIVVVASISNALITLSVFCVAILVTVSISRGAPGPLRMLLFLAYLGQLILIVVGFSLGASVLFLKYRDLNQVWDVVLQAGFFIAPVIWPIETLPERYHFVLYLWPVTPVVQFSREVLIAGTIPTLKAHLLLLAVTATVFVTGVLLFRRHVPSAVERL